MFLIVILLVLILIFTMNQTKDGQHALGVIGLLAMGAAALYVLFWVVLFVGAGLWALKEHEQQKAQAEKVAQYCKEHAGKGWQIKNTDGSIADSGTCEGPAQRPFNPNDYPKADSTGAADDDCYDSAGNLMPNEFASFGALASCGAGQTRKAKSERVHVPAARLKWVETWEACDKAVTDSGHSTKEAYDACRATAEQGRAASLKPSPLTSV